jgi:hypothetical protein
MCSSPGGSGQAIPGRFAGKDAALAGIDRDGHRLAFRKLLQRMGLDPQRRASLKRDAVFTDVAEEDLLADRAGMARARSRSERDIFGTHGDVDVVADLGSVGRGGMKAQAAFALDLNLPAINRANPPRHEVHQSHEVGNDAVGGPGIDLEGRAELLKTAAMHHRDLVGQRQRLGLIMRHIDEGDAGATLKLLQLAAHLLAQLGVEIGERLVKQQDVRLDHQRARKRDPLLLAARELVGEAAFEPLQVDQDERLLDLVADLCRRELPELQAEGNVLVDRLVWPDGVVLEDHAHAACLGRDHAGRRGEQPVVDMDRAGIGRDIARDQPQRRRLAAAGRAEQRDELIVLDLEVEILQRRHLKVAAAIALRQG